jgi:hypothetical protein
MSKARSVVKSVFRGIARVQDTFSIEIGPIRASGVPAILVAVTGIVLAAGIARRLPETLHEAERLAQTLRGDRPRLNP